ncbi:hypothetical protein BBI17_009062, partial [Phytophthora kernoviae]
MQATKIFDDWAEGSRTRNWVSYNEAKVTLKDEPQMVEMVVRAQLSAQQRTVREAIAARKARQAATTRKARAAGEA